MIVSLLSSLLFFTNANYCNLHGKVKIISNGEADYNVYVVENFADMRVQLVDNFPEKSGKWKIVNSFPDFTIKIVQNRQDSDFTVKFVKSYAGC